MKDLGGKKIWENDLFMDNIESGKDVLIEVAVTLEMFHQDSVNSTLKESC